MHLKKITTDYRPLPGVPWAIMKNFAKHGTPGLDDMLSSATYTQMGLFLHCHLARAYTGLECKLFFRHDWDEPFFKFVRSVIESWPAGYAAISKVFWLAFLAVYPGPGPHSTFAHAS